MANNYKNLTVEDCIERSKWSATAAYYGTRPDDDDISPGQALDQITRSTFAQMGETWANLAIAMQNERDYEDRKMREIKEQAQNGGEE